MDCTEAAVPLFDTHAHYDHPLFAGEGPRILRELFDREVVSGVVIPAIGNETNLRRELFPREAFPRVYFAPGLHPKCAVNEPRWSASRTEGFVKLLEEDRTVAVKTGLDRAKRKLTDGQKAHQEHFFRLLRELAESRGLPLVLHVRDAAERFLELLGERPLGVRAAVHCFTYDGETAARMLDAGVTHFGIGGMITRPEMEHLREAVKTLPLESILLETDAPFVRPAGWEGGNNTSETLRIVLHQIAALRGIPAERAAEAVQDNALRFYGLNAG